MNMAYVGQYNAVPLLADICLFLSSSELCTVPVLLVGTRSISDRCIIFV